MKKLLFALLLAPALALGSCTSTGQPDVQKIVDACKTACGFVPTVGSIIAIFTADPTIASVQAVVDLICKGFQASQAAPQAKRATAGQTATFDITVNGKTVIVTGQAVH